MHKVPRNRGTQLERLRSGRQKAIIVGGVPVPASPSPFPGPVSNLDGLGIGDDGNEIDRQPELVRALERSRFRSAFGEQLTLPDGAAVRLEDFEAGLREAGLVSDSEILVQVGKCGTRFRVAKRQFPADKAHIVGSGEGGGPPYGGRSRPSLEVPSPRLTGGAPVKGDRAERPFTGEAGLAHRRMVIRALRAKRGGF